MAKTKEELLAEISLKFDARIAALEPKVVLYGALVQRRSELIQQVEDHFRLIGEVALLTASIGDEPVIKD
jgi:hypothetical protein